MGRNDAMHEACALCNANGKIVQLAFSVYMILLLESVLYVLEGYALVVK